VPELAQPERGDDHSQDHGPGAAVPEVLRALPERDLVVLRRQLVQGVERSGID
jgi:hypothetical protein